MPLSFGRYGVLKLLLFWLWIFFYRMWLFILLWIFMFMDENLCWKWFFLSRGPSCLVIFCFGHYKQTVRNLVAGNGSLGLLEYNMFKLYQYFEIFIRHKKYRHQNWFVFFLVRNLFESLCCIFFDMVYIIGLKKHP